MSKKKKAVTPARLVINCNAGYLEQVKIWAQESGFDSYANYVKFVIALHQSQKYDQEKEKKDR